MPQRSMQANDTIEPPLVESIHLTFNQSINDEVSDSTDPDVLEKELLLKGFARQCILIVDDERSVLLLLREALKTLANCTIVVAESGEQALILYEQHKFDLLITDYNLPGIDGLALAARIRQRAPQIPIMILTAYADDMLRRQAANLSIQQILNKPVKIEMLRHLVATALLEGQGNFVPSSATS